MQVGLYFCQWKDQKVHQKHVPKDSKNTAMQRPWFDPNFKERTCQTVVRTSSFIEEPAFINSVPKRREVMDGIDRHL